MTTDPATRSARSTAIVLAVALGVVIFDQLTKWWALEALTDPTRIVDLFWTFRLRVIHNTGTAFSLTSDSGPFVSVVAVVVVGYLLWSARGQRSLLPLVSYGAIIGGTSGNVLDRIFRAGEGAFGGGVVDFVDPQWFPVFNAADAALVVGIGLLLITEIRGARAAGGNP